ncbi:hypothetical protein FIU95_16930 [Microbulbifer sp. THAF38]|nr:hypothetical protein FIU95_16930 [Microbulbifer sp. THAF38]
MSQELNKIKALFQKLIASEAYPFPEKGQRLDAPNQRGVYIIITNRGSILHVGNTPRGKNGIHQRLKNHLGGSSSFTKKYLSGDGSKLRKGHSFKCLTVVNSRHRVLLEAYAIGVLCPRHIGLGWHQNP